MTTVRFGERLKMAWRILFNAELAGRVQDGLKALDEKKTKEVLPPERVHASGLMLLAALQREGRFLDFIQQDVAGFSDDEIGAAGRVVHAGCRKVLRQHFELEPAVPGPEGEAIAVPSGFDPQRIRLTGNVTGQPPFNGTLKHHGWVAKEVRLPEVSEALDLRVVAP